MTQYTEASRTAQAIGDGLEEDKENLFWHKETLSKLQSKAPLDAEDYEDLTRFNGIYGGNLVMVPTDTVFDAKTPYLEEIAKNIAFCIKEECKPNVGEKPQALQEMKEKVFSCTLKTPFLSFLENSVTIFLLTFLKTGCM